MQTSVGSRSNGPAVADARAGESEGPAPELRHGRLMTASHTFFRITAMEGRGRGNGAGRQGKPLIAEKLWLEGQGKDSGVQRNHRCGVKVLLAADSGRRVDSWREKRCGVWREVGATEHVDELRHPSHWTREIPERPYPNTEGQRRESCRPRRGKELGAGARDLMQ